MRTRSAALSRSIRSEIKLDLETKDLHLHIKQKGRSPKFYYRNVGPYEMSKSQPEISNSLLKLPAQYEIHPNAHDPSFFPGRLVPEPSPIDPDDSQYIVEVILDDRTVRTKREFFVHWEPYFDMRIRGSRVLRVFNL